MSWLWHDKTTPGDLPTSAYRHLVVVLGENPDFVSRLRCVLEAGFVEGSPVTLVRIYDPAQLGEMPIVDFAALDKHPDSILFEGFMNLKEGTAQINRCQQ